MDDLQFINAIRANRDDDVPRLVYSDWLSEREDPRGEFIRVDCELAGCEEGEGGGLERRSLELLKENHEQWLVPLYRLQLRAIQFKRGFVDRAMVSPAAVAKLEREIMTAAPLLDILELDDVCWLSQEAWETTLKSQLFSQVGTLMVRSIEPPQGDESLLEMLFAHAGRSRVHCLVLNSLDLSPREGMLVARQVHEFSHLTELHLGGNQFGNAMAQRLIDSPIFPQLKHVDLRRNRLSRAFRETLQERFPGRISL